MTTIPYCPSCGSTDGALGTSNAYYICHNPDCRPDLQHPQPPRAHTTHEVYYLGDGRHPMVQGKEWKDAVLASPFGREGSAAHFFEEESQS